MKLAPSKNSKFQVFLISRFVKKENRTLGSPPLVLVHGDDLYFIKKVAHYSEF
jgi:hypothetical protein